MSTPIQNVLARFRSLPRAARWLILAAAALALYFPLIDAPLALWRDLADRADARRARLTAFHHASRTTLADDLALGVSRHGILLPPAPRAQASEKLDRAIASIFQARDLPDYTLTSRAVSMTSGPLPDRLALRLERLLKEIQFEADPATALAIIADLERADIIAHAPALQIQRLDDAATLRVRVSVEAWALPESGAPR